jgi:hypothetical protein
MRSHGKHIVFCPEKRGEHAQADGRGTAGRGHHISRHTLRADGVRGCRRRRARPDPADAENAPAAALIAGQVGDCLEKRDGELQIAISALPVLMYPDVRSPLREGRPRNIIFATP